MNRILIGAVFLLSAMILPTQGLQAQEDLRARVETLENELKGLRQLLQKQEEGAAEREKVVAELVDKTDAQEKEIKIVGERQALTLEGLYGPTKAEEFAKKGLSPQFGGVYTKPFLRRFGRNTYLGGYMDASYRSTESSSFREDTKGRGTDRFEVLRFVPFIYSDVSDRVKVAAEIEFEHGGASDRGGLTTDESDKLDGEVKLEFATVDFLLRDEVNFRAGIILVPLGKFNLVHDAPLQDLIDRPLVDQKIIPTTLSQAGMGFFGTFYPTELSKLDYEIYATNGFGDEITGKDGLRGARLFRYDRDNNNSPAIVARIGFSPFLGLEFGGSVYYNKYSSTGSDHFTITALDFAYQRGPFELVGEGAYVGIERGKDVKINNSDVPSSMFGYYIEPRYHFMPEFIHNLAPTIFREDSTFTLVGRWDSIDTGQRSEVSDVRAQRLGRATVGLNFRYTEDTVFKVDYQWNIEHSQENKDNNAFLFGIATYF
ncbi:MAG: hypothetical protein ACE5IC_03095 [Candidatus Brocadiales bacterium]